MRFKVVVVVVVVVAVVVVVVDAVDAVFVVVVLKGGKRVVAKTTETKYQLRPP